MPRPLSLRAFRWLTLGLFCSSALALCLPGVGLQVHAAGKRSRRPPPRPTKRTKPRARPLPRLAEPSLLLIGRYTKRVHDKIQAHWNTGKLPLMELHRRSATVHLWIKADGSLRKVHIIQLSGLTKFDRSLIKAARAAQPLPKPAPALRKWIHYYGVEVLFRKRVFKRKKVPLVKTYKGNNVLYNWQKSKAKRNAPPRRRPRARK